MDPKFFTSQSNLRDWLEKNHRQSQELWVGYYKKGSGISSITWPESVDEALCYGWIDGLRKSIDEVSYKIRFTPRKATSHWSDVNIKRVAELTKLGLMHQKGLDAFGNRKMERSGKTAYEQKSVKLSQEYLVKIKGNQEAWIFFKSLAPSIQKQCIWWIMSAKKEETKLRRLETLIGSSAKGLKIPPLRYGQK